MAEEYPYMVSNNKIGPIFTKIKTAAKPPKFTNEFLKKLGFSSSNDRAVIPLLKRLGFLNGEGAPTEFYDDLKDNKTHSDVIGQQIKELYRDIFSINTDIQGADDGEIKGAISRVTGKDEKAVNRYFATFKALCAIAKFDGVIRKKDEGAQEKEKSNGGETKPELKGDARLQKPSQFHYNIQIHLPATTEISVYNAIFKSLKDNLSL